MHGTAGTLTARYEFPRRSIPDTLRLLLELTRKEVRVRYRNSYLGYLWSVLHPIALACVFYVAFSVIMRFSVEDYALVLLTGLFSWQWFSNSVQGSANVFFSSRDLVRKAALPRALLPVSFVLNDMLHFLAVVPIVLGLVLLHDRMPTFAWLWGVPLLTVAQACLVLGLALVVASGNVFLRDLERLCSVSLMILFYVTPVIYPASTIPERYQLVFALNPMYPLVEGFRTLFVDGVVVWKYVAAAYAWGAASLLFGFAVHRRLEWRIPEAI